MTSGELYALKCGVYKDAFDVIKGLLNGEKCSALTTCLLDVIATAERTIAKAEAANKEVGE